MPTAYKTCSQPGCSELVEPGRGRCAAHTAQARSYWADPQAHGGGGRRTWRRAREHVLARDPLCTCTDRTHGHGPLCTAPSTVADHWPDTRRALVDQGVADPDAPDRMRGLCKGCHDRHTAATSPGGWYAN